MPSTVCLHCNQPLPAGAVFCANCGASVPPARVHLSSSPTPPPAPGAETVRASAPPSGAEYAPTQLQPPPAPEAPVQGSLAGQDAYGSQYAPAPPAPPPPYFSQSGPPAPGGMYLPASGPQGQMMPPAPVYAPGPPPVAVPGGGVQPWAQPPKKRSGAKVVLGCLIAVVLLVAVLGGGGFLLVKVLSSKGGTANHQGNGTGSTPGSSSTPGSNPEQAQTLDNINRQAIYAGVTITVLSAKEAAALPGRQETDPSLNALEVQVKASNQTPRNVCPKVTVLDPQGNTYPLYTSTPASLGLFWNADSVASGALLFDVPRGSKLGDFTIQIGSAEEAQVTVPLSGNYDPTQWQPVTHQIDQTINYENGKIKYTLTQVVVGLWTPGFQAPKGMRLLLMYLHVVNNTALPVGVGDGVPQQYLLVFPNGDRSAPTVIYGAQIDAAVNPGESEDVGYDTFLIPTAPASYTMVFLYADGSIAGQVNLGTI